MLISRRMMLASGLVVTATHAARINVSVAKGVVVAPTTPEAPPALHFPPRPHDALSGSALLDELRGTGLQAIEERIYDELTSGNVPAFMRKLVALHLDPDGGPEPATVWVTPDYLSVGSDEDWLRVPLTAVTAQRIAQRVNAVLPTPDIVDAIHLAAAVRVPPSGISTPPAVMWLEQVREHQRLIHAALAREKYELGALLAGHKKDVVITPALRTDPSKVAIYGLHRPSHEPVQPLSLIHGSLYVDYSHGIRLVANRASRGDQHDKLTTWLRDPATARVFSAAGPINCPAYPLDWDAARALTIKHGG